MKTTLIALIILFGSSLFASAESDAFYNMKLTTLEGKKYSFSELKGKPVLFVNTASKCGFTPQLQDLETIHKKYGPQGLVILAIPSNDFKQETGSDSEILSFAQKEFKTTFTFLEKQKITGENKSELYKFLTSQKNNVIFKEVQWNFEKFLLDKNGKVIDRWSSMTKPSSDSITKKIEEALK